MQCKRCDGIGEVMLGSVPSMGGVGGMCMQWTICITCEGTGQVRPMADPDAPVTLNIAFANGNDRRMVVPAREARAEIQSWKEIPNILSVTWGVVVNGEVMVGTVICESSDQLAA